MKINVSPSLRADYLQVAPMRNFCSAHGLNVSENKQDMINNIVDYAGENEEERNYIEAHEWILKCIREGSNEIYFKKVYHTAFTKTEKNEIEECIQNRFGNVPQKDILRYRNTDTLELINYEIFQRDKKIYLVRFIFSRNVLEGKSHESGELRALPIYVEWYVTEGFLVGRVKAKTGLFNRDGESLIANPKNKVQTFALVKDAIEKVCITLQFSEDTDNTAKNRLQKMLYKLYERYSFTPEEVRKKIVSVLPDAKKYIQETFNKMGIDPCMIVKAAEDMEVFLEKYVAIGGINEEEYKKDREAYIIKISSDDVQDLSRFETATPMEKPLQCTDVFYDSKKTVQKNKQCKAVDLCYNRLRGYLGKYYIRFTNKGKYGLLKTYYHPEECDIQNVLQTIFEIY